MKIILIQYRPAIRLWKWAKTLIREGQQVTIAYTHSPAQGINWDEFEMIKLDGERMFHEYDRVIVFNPGLPNLPYRECGAPVIQAVGDIRSIYDYRPMEIVHMNAASLCVFVSAQQEEWGKYFGARNTAVFHNGLVPELVGERKPKVDNGKINIVYEGTITDKNGNHRCMIEQFKELVSNEGVELNIYPSAVSKVEKYFFRGVRIRPTVKATEIVSELSKYDMGLILFTREEVADTSLPNKLNEYLAAGIPILSGRYDALVEWNKGKNAIGFTDKWTGIEPLLKRIKAKRQDVSKHAEYYDGKKLVELIYKMKV